MAHVGAFRGLLGLLAATVAAAPAGAQPIEYAVKASYLYKFAPFVQWPPTAFANPAAPLAICIAGHDPFGKMLDEAVRGQRVNGHPIEIRRIDAIRPGIACHILFASGEGSDQALRALAHEPVLTVTDRSHGGTGGMIQFVTIGGRIRFAVDQAAAEQSGITISSKLLGLAVSVTR